MGHTIPDTFVSREFPLPVLPTMNEAKENPGGGTYRLTDVSTFLGELGGVDFLVLLDPPVHLLPFHLLLACPEGSLQNKTHTQPAISPGSQFCLETSGQLID